MDIKYMFICDMVRHRVIEVKHIRTSQMIADALTKGLGWIRHEEHIKGMGLMKGSVGIQESSAWTGSGQDVSDEKCKDQKFMGLDNMCREGGKNDAFKDLCHEPAQNGTRPG